MANPAVLGLVTPSREGGRGFSSGPGGRGHRKSRHGLEWRSRVATPAEQLQGARPTPGPCPSPSAYRGTYPPLGRAASMGGLGEAGSHPS